MESQVSEPQSVRLEKPQISVYRQPEMKAHLRHSVGSIGKERLGGVRTDVLHGKAEHAGPEQDACLLYTSRCV